MNNTSAFNHSNLNDRRELEQHVSVVLEDETFFYFHFKMFYEVVFHFEINFRKELEPQRVFSNLKIPFFV